MIAAGAFCAVAQIRTTTTPKSEPPPKPTVKTTPTPDAKGAAPKQITPETVVETALIFAYAYPGGRATLNQIRKTTLERGKATFTSAEGKSSSTYQRYIIRGETVGKEKIRLDQDFPNAKYSLVYEEDKIYGIFNNSVFAPREDAAKSFENQIVHGIEPLLRYKEDGSTLEMGAREKIEGVDFYVIDLTDKKERKTRYYVSAKSFRVMMLTYEDGGVKYKRKFYDYNIAQGTLVPYQTVLWADDKKVEETEIGTITFGQKVDEELFKAG